MPEQEYKKVRRSGPRHSEDSLLNQPGRRVATSTKPHFIQRLRSTIDALRKRDKELRWPDY
jgi:hypothetical protein